MHVKQAISRFVLHARKRRMRKYSELIAHIRDHQEAERKRAVQTLCSSVGGDLLLCASFRFWLFAFTGWLKDWRLFLVAWGSIAACPGVYTCLFTLKAGVLYVCARQTQAHRNSSPPSATASIWPRNSSCLWKLNTPHSANKKTLCQNHLAPQDHGWIGATHWANICVMLNMVCMRSPVVSVIDFSHMTYCAEVNQCAVSQ